MSKKSENRKHFRFWAKIVALICSLIAGTVYTDHRVEAAMCSNLSSKVFDYNYWVVCEQFRLAGKYNFLMNGELPNEEKPQVEEADAL